MGRVLPTASLDHAHRDGLCHHFANLVGTISKRRAHNVYLRRCNGSPIVVARGHLSFPRERRSKMTWKTPKIVEVPVGMEINMYACAARK
jgi:coenzyme PQQ precursor peptide PqqA